MEGMWTRGFVGGDVVYGDLLERMWSRGLVGGMTRIVGGMPRTSGGMTWMDGGAKVMVGERGEWLKRDDDGWRNY